MYSKWMIDKVNILYDLHVYSVNFNRLIFCETTLIIKMNYTVSNYTSNNGTKSGADSSNAAIFIETILPMAAIVSLALAAMNPKAAKKLQHIFLILRQFQGNDGNDANQDHKDNLSMI